MRRTVDWSSDGPKLFGGLLVVAAFITWLFTGRVEPLFVTTGGGLVAVGQGAQALAELKKLPEPPSSPPDTGTHRIPSHLADTDM